MPKPMLNQPQTQNRSESILSATARPEQKQKNTQMSKMQIDRVLRKKRSKEYMDAMHKLDAGGHTHNKAQVDEIINTLREEFPEIELQGTLLGCVAICYLGRPYEVHTITLEGMIIEHYKAGETLPSGLEKARSIAMHGGYAFIEVYADCCRAVSSNGTVSVIPN